MNTAFCITEGSLDTIWLDQNGFPSCALLGLNMSKRQEDLIISKQPSEIILCLDNDDPGQLASDKIYNRLSRRLTVTSISIPQGYKDVQDIRDPVLLKKVLEERSFL